MITHIVHEGFIADTKAEDAIHPSLITIGHVAIIGISISDVDIRNRILSRSIANIQAIRSG